MIGHACSLNHCAKCGDCITPPRILCFACASNGNLGSFQQPIIRSETCHICQRILSTSEDLKSHKECLLNEDNGNAQ